MDKILQAFNDIAVVLPRLDKLQATFGTSEDFQQVLSLIYSDIIEFHQQAYKVFRRKGLQIWFAFDWGLFERRFKSILSRLASHCDLIDKEAAAMHYIEIRERRKIDEESFERHRTILMTKDVFGWLSAADGTQEEYLHQLSDRRLDGTCNWILNEDPIYRWVEHDEGDNIVWMTGIPGAGKSFLCSLIIEHLGTRTNQASLYYFCGSKTSDQTSCASILRTLAVQFLQQNLDMAPLVHQAYLQKGKSLSSPSVKGMLKELLISAKSTRIVLDGIDEYDYPMQQEVIRSLLDLTKYVCDGGSHCKILISSRLEPRIDKALPHKLHIPLDTKTSAALHIYVQKNVEDLRDCHPDFTRSLLDRAENRMQEKANGMFLWVHLVTEMLKKQISEAKFESAIERLPEGLKDAYGLILSRFDDLAQDLKVRVSRILYWVCMTCRSINIQEVADGIAIEPGQRLLNKQTRSRNLKRDILDVCAPILELSERGNLNVVHFSAKEYLLDEQTGPFIDMVQAHFDIAFSCIVNLTSCLVLVPRYSGDMAETSLETLVVQGSFGLQSYAHHFWADHVKAYLKESLNPNSQHSSELASALASFSNVYKQDSKTSFETASSTRMHEVLAKAHQDTSFTPLIGFVVWWLGFRSQLHVLGADFESLRDQEQWQLVKDETYLSLIDVRLRNITERLLEMDPLEPPPHIDMNDLNAFISRFGYVCRYHNCTQHFKTLHKRDAHEKIHIPSFPCLQCDFSGRGFRSRKDLDRHTRKYHVSAEELEIPASLEASDAFFGNSSIQLLRSRFSVGCWNARGRKVLQRGFRQILASLDAKKVLTEHDLGQSSPSGRPQPEEMDTHSEDAPSSDSLVAGLKSIREKVESEQYQTMRDFRDDIRRVQVSLEPHAKVDKTKEIDDLCQQELQTAFINDGKTPATSEAQIGEDYVGEEKLLRQDMDLLHESHGNDDDQSVLPFRVKAPYWSVTEEETFPKLLERHGHDFAKISDHLKTKTISEVEHHFLHLSQSGRGDLPSLANAADARSDAPLQPTQPILGSIDGKEVDQGFSYGSLQIGPNGHAMPLATNSTYLTQPGATLGKRDAQSMIGDGTLSPETAPTDSTGDQRPKKYKRNPPPRAFCPKCDLNPGGLHNQGALDRHDGRFHKPTREVWCCEDISIDKKFLAGCVRCSYNYRYDTEKGALGHLSRTHFGANTPQETLLRWTTKTEEPNLNYRKTPSTASSTEPVDKLPSRWEAIERRNKGGKRGRHKIADVSAFPKDLPALLNMPEEPLNLSSKLSSPVPSDLHQESDDGILKTPFEAGFNSLDESILFQDVSFDHLLPGDLADSESAPISGVPPHQANRALIRPDQVHKLPHLTAFRKYGCQDQVGALHNTLNREPVDSKRYREALESLKSLSLKLLKDLRDWRRTKTLAPSLPFSIP